MTSENEKASQEMSRKLELIVKLLGIIATEKDFSSYSQEHQIVTLTKRGLRNIEVANLFGIKPQQVNNALLKKKRKKQ